MEKFYKETKVFSIILKDIKKVFSFKEMCSLFFKTIFSLVKGVNVICLTSIGSKVRKKDFGECCKDLLI